MDKAKTRRRNSLLFIIRFIIENNNSPSYRQICSEVGISSTSTAARDIDLLCEKGYLIKEEGLKRSLRLVHPACLSFLRAVKTSEKIIVDDIDFLISALTSDRLGLAPHDKISRNDILDIPLFGNVAAGAPIYADDHVEELLPLPASFFPNDGGQYFILKINGQSMIEAGIYDGDHVIVKRQNYAMDGQMVVALIEDEATVKSFYKFDDHIELRPENAAYSPIIVKDCKILGLVVGLYRLY